MSSLSDFSASVLPIIESDLQKALEPTTTSPALFYRMLHYHMGWVDTEGNPAQGRSGKRIRPMLCLLTASGASGDYQRARSAAAAVELIHNFSLLHDDIQDQSPTRRNRATVWQIWGNAQAINAGDALFALAHLAINRLATAGINGDLKAQMLVIVDETALELTRGQHMDIAFETREQVSTGEYLDMIGGKTAALTGAAAELGALAGGATGERLAHYREFGKSLGMAFQIQDDILDIWGKPELTGKEEAIDIQQRKKSFPVLFGLEQSAELRALYGKAEPFDHKDVQAAIQHLDRCGARDQAESQARQYSDRTIQALEMADPQEPAGSALLELVGQLLRRER